MKFRRIRGACSINTYTGKIKGNRIIFHCHVALFCYFKSVAAVVVCLSHINTAECRRALGICAAECRKSRKFVVWMDK